MKLLSQCEHSISRLSWFLSPAPVVTWYRNNQVVKPSKYFHMESSPDGVHSLTILEAFPEDTGVYKCVARNKAGETTVTCQLKVYGECLPLVCKTAICKQGCWYFKPHF